MTRINLDDPKWTAYILGELDDAERAAVDLELESSEEARTLVEELRFAADFTKTELRAQGALRLTRDQREAIRASASVVRPRRWFGTRPAIWAAGLAAASIALMVALVPLSMRKHAPTAPQTASSAPALIAEAQQDKETIAPDAIEQPKPGPKDALRYEHPTGPSSNSLTTPAPTNIETPAAEVVQAVPGVPVQPSTYDQATAPSPDPLTTGALKKIETPGDEVVQAAPAVPVQTSTNGRVFGTVQDATGARLPGVTITATNTQTGTVTTGVADAAGTYALEGLQSGTYKLRAEIPGFREGTFDGIQLNGQTQQDITLQVGAVSEAVEVAAVQAGANKNARLDAPSPASRAQAAPPTTGGGVGGGVFRPLRQAAAAPPPPPPNYARLRDNGAPGVPLPAPPLVDRTAPGVYNGREAYDRITDNPFLAVDQDPLSTFSIDVDTASYSIVRRYIDQYQLPPRDAVRIEEMINYFTYDYPQPSGNAPIGVRIEAAAAPWNPQHRLVRVGIKARDMDSRRRPSSNLVFLLDVSGSMEPPERLPLLKNALRMLVDQLTPNDRVTVVTYASSTGVALRPTRGDQKDRILSLIGSLQAGGSTNGGSGIQLAYEQATANFITGGVNRVILATDGDFNVGITDRNALLRLIEEKAKTGVFLSVLGVGMGNYKDATLETLADKGHGNYAYLDTLNEARKVLVEQMSSTLVTVAKDVKIQVEINPAVVGAYRLIGYENRALRNEDFNNDLKDAGDMGAGHTVTVLYEVVPRGIGIDGPGVEPLKYQQPAAPPPNASNETLTVKVRYKEPSGSDSKLLVFPLVDREQSFARATPDFRFAAAVASFGMLLRDSPYKGTATIGSVLSMAEDSLGSDRSGYRREFLQLLQRVRQIRGR